MDDSLPIPYALGPEKAVLSVLLQYPEGFDEVPWLSHKHFHLPGHRIVFEAIKDRFRDTGDLELVGLIHALHSKGQLDRIGGPSALTDIYTYQPSPSHLKHHAEILAEFAARREAIAKADLLRNAAYEAGDTAELQDAANAAASAVEAILTQSSDPPSTKETLLDSLERFEGRVAGTETSMGIPTLPLIDDLIHGCHPGRIWVIGAYPEGGKSVLASQIVLDVAMAGHPAAFVSLEMPARDIMDRMIIQAARIDAEQFTDPLGYAKRHGMEKPTVQSLQLIKRAAMQIKDLPLMLVKPANRRLSTVLAAIRRCHRECGARVLAVDYLQLINAESDSREGEISEASHSLQQIAGELGVTLLILTQLNQDGDTKHGRVIEEDADAVIQIVQDRNKESQTYKQHRFILLQKDRHYGNGGRRIPLVLDRDTIRFKHGMDETDAGSKTKPKYQR